MLRPVAGPSRVVLQHHAISRAARYASVTDTRATTQPASGIRPKSDPKLKSISRTSTEKQVVKPTSAKQNMPKNRVELASSGSSSSKLEPAEETQPYASSKSLWRSYLDLTPRGKFLVGCSFGVGALVIWLADKVFPEEEEDAGVPKFETILDRAPRQS